MGNKEFVNKYGKKEFIDICNYICTELALAKIQRKIGNFKINNSKHNVLFYRKNKSNVMLDMATIYGVGCNNLSKYIEKM